MGQCLFLEQSQQPVNVPIEFLTISNVLHRLSFVKAFWISKEAGTHLSTEHRWNQFQNADCRKRETACCRLMNKARNLNYLHILFCTYSRLSLCMEPIGTAFNTVTSLPSQRFKAWSSRTSIGHAKNNHFVNIIAVGLLPKPPRACSLASYWEKKYGQHMAVDTAPPSPHPTPPPFLLLTNGTIPSVILLGLFD